MVSVRTFVTKNKNTLQRNWGLVGHSEVSFLFVGNLLTLDTDGETALIPADIMRFSIEQAPTINVEASLRLLASPGTPSDQVQGFETSDPVIRLIGTIFKLAEVNYYKTVVINDPLSQSAVPADSAYHLIMKFLSRTDSENSNHYRPGPWSASWVKI